MCTGDFQTKVIKSCCGFVLLTLLISIAIMFLLFTMYTGMLSPFAPFQGTWADRYSDPNAYPWDEGHLFIYKPLDGYDMSGRRPPFKSQPELVEELHYKADVYAGNEKRGRIDIKIDEYGDVLAFWDAEFRLNYIYYQTPVRVFGEENERSNIFEGNTAPLKIYEDQKGTDPSKLYFISEGPLVLEGSKVEEDFFGLGYVTGWIGKDYAASGKIATPSFVDGRITMFEWGPVKPVKKQP